MSRLIWLCRHWLLFGDGPGQKPIDAVVLRLMWGDLPICRSANLMTFHARHTSKANRLKLNHSICALSRHLPCVLDHLRIHNSTRSLTFSIVLILRVERGGVNVNMLLILLYLCWRLWGNGNHIKNQCFWSESGLSVLIELRPSTAYVRSESSWPVSTSTRVLDF